MDDILSQIIAYAPDKIDTELKARALVQGSRNMDQEPRTSFKKGLSAKQINLFNSAKEFYKNTDANIKSDIRKNIITKATVGSRKKAAVLIKKENLINLTEMGDILDIKENIPAERGTPTSGFRSKIVEAMTRKDSRLSPSKETFLNDYLIKKLKLQKINVGQGKPTYFIKKPNAAEIKDIKKYFIGKSGNFEPVVENRVRLFHSDPVLNKYAKKGLFLPQTTEMSEYLKKKGMTYNQAAYAQNKLTQIYNGGQNSNYLLKDIGINRVAANTFFRATANLPFNNPYRQLQYRDAMETITKEIGSDYFGKKGSMLNFKNKARLILKEAGIPIYDAKKGKKAFGINLNELTGVTAASRTGTSPYSQFFNLAEGKFNLGRYAQFNRTFEEFQNKLDNEINKGKKGNPNQIIKDYNIKRNSLLKEYNFLKENDVPKLSLKDPTEIYGKKRIAELKAQGLDLDENFKTKKYTIDVGKKTPTIKEFNIDPEVQKTQINNLNKDLLKLAGTANKKCKGLLSYGGRVGLAEGLSPEFCINEGRKVAQKALFQEGATPAQKSIARRLISSGGKIAISMLNPKELIKLKNLVGPGALGLMAAYEVGSITDDVLRLNKPLDEALAGNWLTKSFLPYSEEFAKQKNLLQSGASMSNSQKEYALEMMKIEKAIKEDQRIQNMESTQVVDGAFDDNFIINPQKKIDAAKEKFTKQVSGIKESSFVEGSARQLENKALMDDYEDAQKARTGASTIFGGPQRLVNTAPRPKNMGRGPMTEKKRMNLDFSIPGITPYNKTYTPSDKEISDYYQTLEKPRPLNPGEATEIRMGMGGEGLYGTQGKFAGGGIAGLSGGDKSGRPPESGPASQGLRSLFNNGKKR